MIPFSSLEEPRVIIIAVSGIGNLLMASPLLPALKQANPRTIIDVLAAPRGTNDLLVGHPRIRRILIGKPKPSVRAWLSMVQHLQRGHYDIGIVTHPGQLVTSASLVFFGNVHRRIGHRYTWILLQNSGALLTDPVDLLDHRLLDLADRRAHDVVQNLHLLYPLGIRMHAAETRYDFPLNAEDHTRAQTWIGQRKLDGRMLIGLHPGSHPDLMYKRWPADRWSDLGRRMADQFRAQILVFGGSEEELLITTIASRISNESATAVHLPLRAAAALIARCHCFVANDSGLMHVAASQDVPTFGLFGPTDERRTGPWGPQGHVIRALGTQPVYDVRHLAQARRHHQPHPSILALSVDRVLHVILNAREDQRAAPPIPR